MPDTRRALANPPFQNIGTLLDGHRRRAPDKPALIDAERDVTICFDELAILVDAVAVQLCRHGARKGSRIVLADSEGLEKLLLWLGIWRIGAIACPVNIAFVGPAIAGHVLNVIAPSLILLSTQTDAGLIPATDARVVRYEPWSVAGQSETDALRFAAAAIGGDAAPDCTVEMTDMASMCCTSGTTGMPKMVVYDHACYWFNGLDSIEFLDLTANDYALEYRSFDWYSAQILSLMPFLQIGSTLCVARRFSRSRFADWVQKYHVTVCAGVPTVLNLLLEASIDVDSSRFASLRVMTCSTAPLSPLQWTRFEEKYGIRVINLYGSSEAGWMCGNRVYRGKIGTVGYPATHIGFQIIDIHGAPCAPGQDGQIVVSGSKLALGVLHPDGTLRAIRGADLYTCDIAMRDDDGFVWMSGRMDDLIIRGGVKIVPREIEDVLLMHPQIRDAAAVGVPESIYGQEPICFIVPRPSSNLGIAEVLTHCHAHLPSEKMPKQIYMVDALPRSGRGKILRDVLRREWWTAAHGHFK